MSVMFACSNGHNASFLDAAVVETIFHANSPARQIDEFVNEVVRCRKGNLVGHDM